MYLCISAQRGALRRRCWYHMGMEDHTSHGRDVHNRCDHRAENRYIGILYYRICPRRGILPPYKHQGTLIWSWHLRNFPDMPRNILFCSIRHILPLKEINWNVTIDVIHYFPEKKNTQHVPIIVKTEKRYAVPLCKWQYISSKISKTYRGAACQVSMKTGWAGNRSCAVTATTEWNKLPICMIPASSLDTFVSPTVIMITCVFHFISFISTITANNFTRCLGWQIMSII